MNKGKKFGVFIVILLIAILCILIIILNNTKNNQLKELQQSTTNIEENIKPKQKVKDVNWFYTVNTCVDRYLTYLSEKNTDSLMKVLDKNYISYEGITEQNLWNKIESPEFLQILSVQAMYEGEMKGNIKTYYVSGTVRDDIMDMQTEEKPFYVTVKLDTVNQTFSIMPEGYMFSVKTKKESENEFCYIAIHQVDTYYNKSEIDITIKNKTNQPLELSNLSLEYYEEGVIQSLGDNTVLTVEGNVSKEFKLVFENKVNIPHKLNYKIKGQEYSIEIVKNTDIE